MSSKKVSSADNQQERLEIKSWIIGFVDGEGSFLISIFRNKTTKSGWQVFPEFVVSQGAKSLNALKMIRKFFRCGAIFINRRHDNHHQDIYRYCVRSLKDLIEKIIPFFEKHRLMTAKRKDFIQFKRIVKLMKNGNHLKSVGFKKIKQITLTMNRKGNKNL